MTKEFVPSEEHVKLGDMVIKSMTESNAILIRNHGPVCIGRNLEEAKICCLVVEKNCGIYLDLLASGRFNEIPEEFVKAGRNYFLYKYGKS